MDLARIPTWNEDEDAVHVVVEAPRGCGLKLKYEPDLKAFVFGKALPVGLTYPYDWGFVPSTRAEDGDPLDALVLTDVPSYPGVVIPCRLLGAVLVDQKGDDGRERNDRVIAVPVDAERYAELKEPDDLSDRMREEIEQFFLDTTFFTHKDARVHGWKDSKYAARKVRKAERKRRR